MISAEPANSPTTTDAGPLQMAVAICGQRAFKYSAMQ